MAAPGITLKVVTERAQAIHRALTDEFDLDKATQEATKLYQEGIQLVHAQLNSKPLFPEIASPVLFKLDEVVPLSTLQHQFSFHKALSKAYRVFAELTWYQCGMQKRSLTVYPEAKDALIDNSKKITKNLQKDDIELKFEYGCARQAAKCLTPAGGIWAKYLDHILNIGESAESLSVFGILKGIKDIAIDAQKDWIKGWYPDIHYLRWISLGVKTQQDFEKFIAPEPAHFKQKGGKHTLCLAVVCKELIQNPQVEEDVKKLACECLVDLCKLVDKDRKTNILNGIKKRIDAKPINKLAKKEDRYWLTRCLILQYAEEFVKSKSHPELTSKIIEALEAVKTSHADEKQAIQGKLKELRGKVEENQEFIDARKAVLEPTMGEEGLSEAEAQTVRKEMDEATQENKEIETEIKVLIAIEELNDEEQKLLAEAKTPSVSQN